MQPVAVQALALKTTVPGPEIYGEGDEPKLATPVGTERSQIAQITPKWLGESAKGGLGLHSGSAEKVSRTGASPVRTSANLFRTSARDFFCTSALEPQTTFRTLP